jgi:hypothetical protein
MGGAFRAKRQKDVFRILIMPEDRATVKLYLEYSFWRDRDGRAKRVLGWSG